MSKPRRRPLMSDRHYRANRHVHADHATAERWQPSGRTLEVPECAGILSVPAATEEHLIDILFLRRLLTPSEREAAMKFKLDYQRAGLEARLISRYTTIARARDFFANIPERNDFEEAAYQRWRDAVRSIGKFWSDAVITTVCHDLRPASDALPLLQEGLRKLVDWYSPEKDLPGSGQNIDQAAAR